jgi:hypothetical protein
MAQTLILSFLTRLRPILLSHISIAVMSAIDRPFLLFVSLSTWVLGIAPVSLAQLTHQIAVTDKSHHITQPISTRAADLQVQPFSTTVLPALDAGITETTIAQTKPQPTPTETTEPAPSRPVEQGVRVPPNLNEGVEVDRVFIYLRNPSGDATRDEQIKREIANAFGLRAGSSFSSLFASRGVSQVERLPSVRSAEYRLYESTPPGRVTIALLVTLQPGETTSSTTQPTEQPKKPRGIFVNGNFLEFPTLYESDSTLLKIFLNGSAGVFSDTNPWFSNPQNFLSGTYRPFGTTTWGEFSLEAGLAGITELGQSPFYLYGAATYTLSATVQPDIFRTDNRFYGDVEKLYAGLLYAKKGTPFAINLSGGRQNFQLNQGFLFSQFSGSANALDRSGSFLNPRTAYRTSILADVKLGNFKLRGFFLQPDELAIADTRTRYLGTSLIYNNNRNLDLSLSYIAVPQSEKEYLLPGGLKETREGLQVINPRIRLSSLFGVDGLWTEAEFAHEFNSRFPMSANGGYIWLGYKANKLPWRPSISYRFAGFSGDDPKTSTYERFDSLQAGGLTDWLQGLSLGKISNNSNNFTHRVSLEVQPSESFSLALTYFYRYADQLNNLGGSRPLQVLKSHDLGQEVQLLARYFVSQNFLLQGLTSIAIPGSAIRRAVSDTADPWFTFQVSVYMFF